MQVETPFNEAIIKKYPEQVVIVLVKGDDDVVNPITIGWTMLTSHEPPMMAFSVGIKRYSLELLRQSKDYVIAFPSENQKDAVLLFGTKTGAKVNKLKESGLETTPAKIADCVLLSDAVANFECTKFGEYPTGDHVIIVGTVVASYINPEPVKRVFNCAKGYKLSGISIDDKEF